MGHLLNIRGVLHTSKRMHFIEEILEGLDTPFGIELAYVKTYALH